MEAMSAQTADGAAREETFRIRRGRVDDALALARIEVSSFVGDPWLEYIYRIPLQPSERVPPAFYRWLARTIARQIAREDEWVVWVVEDGETVAGYAQWHVLRGQQQRRRPGEPVWRAWLERLRECYYAVRDTAEDHVYGQLYGDTEHSVPYWALMDVFADRFLHGRDHIYLKKLAIDPSYQKRGLGRRLLQTGFPLSEQLQLPIYLEATPAGARLYAKNGYIELGHDSLPGKNPGESVNTYFMLYEPPPPPPPPQSAANSQSDKTEAHQS